MAIVRLIFAVLLSLSIVAVASPLHSQLLPKAGSTCCCKHMLDPSGAHHKGCGEPAKPQDRQCCVNCPIGLTLLPTSLATLAFQKRDAENLAIDDAFVASRFDRPPVPPPRVTVFA
jgi:hypothetical protein